MAHCPDVDGSSEADVDLGGWELFLVGLGDERTGGANRGGGAKLAELMVPSLGAASGLSDWTCRGTAPVLHERDGEG